MNFFLCNFCDINQCYKICWDIISYNKSQKHIIMKTKVYQIIVLFILSQVFMSCRNEPKTNQNSIVNTEQQEKAQTQQIDEFNLLADYLKKSGNYINSPYCPAMIDAQKVYENLNNKNYLVIDIRKPEHFEQGHIKGAQNVNYHDIVNYFENQIQPADYEKIAIVCYSGQAASYVTSLLNMMGYDNVYAMKFGMSAWNKENAKNYWLKNISDKYIDKLETKDQPKHKAGSYPKLYTGETEVKNILNKQAENILMDPFKSKLVSADDVFNNKDKYYVINYWPKDHYLQGHIPDAVQYTPKKSLSKDTFLNTLPTDKPIVIYCFTGQHASMVAAYLNLLGYDARVLKYGANSFMHSKLVKNKWHPFTPKKIHNFKLESALQEAY